MCNDVELAYLNAYKQISLIKDKQILKNVTQSFFENNKVYILLEKKTDSIKIKEITKAIERIKFYNKKVVNVTN
jgi:hypothetical protein